jgi:hypothetical protein
MTKRILAVLALGVVACDDPEVASKAADLLTYGLVEARIECKAVTDGVNPYGQSGWPSEHTVTYSQSRMADGSCLVSFSDGSNGYSAFYGRSENKCSAAFEVSDNPLGQGWQSYPDNPATDVTKYSISNGELEIEYCDPWIENLPANPPYWIPFCPYDSGCPQAGCIDVPLLQNGCTGFNLEAFE